MSEAPIDNGPVHDGPFDNGLFPDEPFNHPPRTEAPIDNGLLFARVFAGADGEKVLAHLRGLTIDRRPPPDIDDAVLRHLEGQRYLVAYIMALVARG